MSVIIRFRRLAGKHNKLANMANNIVNDVQQAMIEQIQQAVDIMGSEPPPKPESSYQRIHNYADSWQPIFPRASGGRLEGGIIGGFGLRYAVYVGGDSHGDGQQQQHFDTGWPLAAEAIDGIAPGGVRLTSAGDRIRNAVHHTVERS